jgi:DNA-binding NarL/FixJ family response regulator
MADFHIGTAHAYDVVLINAALYRAAAIRALVRLYADKPVYIVTSESKKRIFFGMTGINGVFFDDCSAARMLQAIAVMTGAKKNDTRQSQISVQDTLVLAALKTGASNKQIAREYDIPLSRVKYHLQRIYTYFGVSCRIQAALLAQQIGL